MKSKITVCVFLSTLTSCKAPNPQVALVSGYNNFKGFNTGVPNGFKSTLYPHYPSTGGFGPSLSFNNQANYPDLASSKYYPKFHSQSSEQGDIFALVNHAKAHSKGLTRPFGERTTYSSFLSNQGITNKGTEAAVEQAFLSRYNFGPTKTVIQPKNLAEAHDKVVQKDLTSDDAFKEAIALRLGLKSDVFDYKDRIGHSDSEPGTDYFHQSKIAVPEKQLHTKHDVLPSEEPRATYTYEQKQPTAEVPKAIKIEAPQLSVSQNSNIGQGQISSWHSYTPTASVQRVPAPTETYQRTLPQQQFNKRTGFQLDLDKDYGKQGPKVFGSKIDAEADPSRVAQLSKVFGKQDPPLFRPSSHQRNAWSLNPSIQRPRYQEYQSRTW